MVNRRNSPENSNVFRTLLWILAPIVIVILVTIIGLAYSGDGEIQAPGADRETIVVID